VDSLDQIYGLDDAALAAVRHGRSSRQCWTVGLCLSVAAITM
jgi:hypothetical protein